MSAAIRKLEGVESVEVSHQKASAEIRLKAGNTITLPQMRRIIRSIGYPTKDAEITARGRIVITGADATLDLLNGSVLPIVEGAKGASEAVVEVAGVSQPGDGKDEERLTLKSIK